jgi:hypothetical protein
MHWRELSEEYFEQLKSDMITHDPGWLWDNLEIKTALQWSDFKPKWFTVLVTGCNLSPQGQLAIRGDLDIKVDCQVVRAKFLLLWRNEEIILEDQTMTIPLTAGEEHVLGLEKQLWA